MSWELRSAAAALAWGKRAVPPLSLLIPPHPLGTKARRLRAPPAHRRALLQHLQLQRPHFLQQRLQPAAVQLPRVCYVPAAVKEARG